MDLIESQYNYNTNEHLRDPIFEEFQPMWSQFTNVIDRQTDRRTDRRHAIPIPRFALKCIAR